MISDIFSLYWPFLVLTYFQMLIKRLLFGCIISALNTLKWRASIWPKGLKLARPPLQLGKATLSLSCFPLNSGGPERRNHNATANRTYKAFYLNTPLKYLFVWCM